MNWTIRPMVAGDHPRVFSDWIRSYARARPVTDIPAEVYSYWQHRLIENLFSDRTTGWLVACSQTDPLLIYGWLCHQRSTTLVGDQGVVHYVYTRKSYRRHGVATSLLEAAGLAGGLTLLTTHRTPAWAGLEAAMALPAIYNPFVAWARCGAPTGAQYAPQRKLRSEVAESRRANAHRNFIVADHETPLEGGYENEVGRETDSDAGGSFTVR